MDKIRSAKALMAFAEESDQRLSAIRKELAALSGLWGVLLTDGIEPRLSTAARFAHLPEPVIGEYVGSIVVSIERIKLGLIAPVDDLRATSVTMGSVSHCASVLRHKARREMQGRLVL